MRDDNDTIYKVASVAAVILAIALIFSVGYVLGKHEIRVEAVKTGHAKWVPDEDGRSTFEWTRETPCKPAAK